MLTADDKEESYDSILNTPSDSGEASPTEQTAHDEKHQVSEKQTPTRLEATTNDPSTRVEVTTNDPPNGGIKAWLQVFGAFFLMMNCWGIVNSFGVFQTYYETGLLSSSSASDISWIGSIQGFLLLVMGVVTGPLFDKGYFYAEIWTGSFLSVFGIMMTSLSTQYWQVMLAQGICLGLGSGCLFVPLFAVIPQYFTTRKSFAIGIVASGSSVGGIIYPIIFYKLQPQIGFAWTTRVMGFIALATFAVPLIVMRVRIIPAEKRAFFEREAFRELPYSILCLGLFVAFMGLYTLIFYIQLYSIQEHITSEKLGFYTLPLLNASSIFGRIVPNYIADQVGAMNVLIPCSLAASALCFCWIGIVNAPGIIILAVLYGFFSGAFVSLPPSAIVSMSLDLGLIGTRMGMCFGITAFGILIGSPVAGAILSSTGRFLGLELFAGCTVLVGAALMIAARCSKFGLKVFVKA